jgi:hypothetical protein
MLFNLYIIRLARSLQAKALRLEIIIMLALLTLILFYHGQLNCNSHHSS